MADCGTSRDYDALSPALSDKLYLKTTDSSTENQNAEAKNANDNEKPCDKGSPLLSPNLYQQHTKLTGNEDSYIANMFGLVPERYVTFCIDTSGSMFNALDVVKAQLMETLSSIATRENKVMFNLIEFNSQVTQWADKLVHCTPETVAVAGQWVNNLRAKTGTNTQGALFAALADPDCQAVYLVTDDIPDQYTQDVLDNILAICGSRRIHCIYITGDAADEAATEFLEDLAVETYGSFTIVKLFSNGSIEKLIQVYRSEPSHEKLVWTVNNTLRPNIKTCSISTTLQIDPDDVLGSHPLDNPLMFNSNPIAVPSSLLRTYADRYYYPHYWSRYHPAKCWLKAQDKLQEPLLGLSHVAGSLMIGKKVIARRLEDGYFYRGTIQSQNFGKSFLVSFGPSKLSKFNQTEYEDVFIFDVVDYCDALRHAIVTGDRVLAPEQPDGEWFAPGIVIDGQEKRQTDGPDDKDLTICFSNGKTETVPRDVAVWIPPTMYDRLSLELQMSASARKSIFTTLKNYPTENLPGYPKLDYPAEYFRADPLAVEPNPYLWEPSLYWYPPYLPTFYSYPPFVVKQRAEKGRRSPLPLATSDDDSALIPNTGMTKQELEERVMLQLMEHRCCNGDLSADKHVDRMSDGSKQNNSTTSSRILGKREKQEENLLNKHVQFKMDERTDTLTDEDRKYFNDSDYDDYGNHIRKNDSSVNTDSSLLFYSSPGIEQRPGWRKYWRSDPSPSLTVAGEGSGGARKLTYPKTFRETALQAPLEARDKRNPPYDVEWPSSAFRYVDVFAKHDHSNSVRECLSAPQLSSEKNVRPGSQSYSVASQPMAKLTSEEKEELRRANRRIAALARSRERREQIQIQRDKEIQECVERREQIRKQNNEAHVKANVERLDEEGLQAAKLEKQHHNAKMQRLRHFRKLENEGQKKKDLRIAVAEQQQALNRSQIFS